ncbi:hypothetical protein HK097_011585 [Rhizophlyctis rosea]|uniref:HIT domain-containing protein n=1 Tax=Rhizophlyctis rosea TaxID=64517 RepID=A0AAD5S7M3_9FUNG|nr:hypothetical protein HK097_011585 [Rhizophlyctis rosea]
MVIPRRVVKRFSDLTLEEVSDMFISAQQIGGVIEKEFGGESLTITIQDGPASGQTVPHVHVHIIPRKRGDWADNDDIYPELDRKEKELGKELKDQHEPHKAVPRVDNEERKPRSQDEMAAESASLRKFFTQFEDIWS